MKVSPTEPKQLRAIGMTSSLPEKYGADFLFASAAGLVGVQRKEIKDLVASLRDGRLGKELAQMDQLDVRVLVVEGELRWSEDGYLLNATSFTRDQLNGVLFSIQMMGVWFLGSRSITETSQLLVSLESWLSKAKHSGFTQRPKATGEWGNVTSRDWGIHWWQAFDGIGAGTAAALYDSVGVPVKWTVTEEELRKVKGVGKVRAKKMMEALG